MDDLLVSELLMICEDTAESFKELLLKAVKEAGCRLVVEVDYLEPDGEMQVSVHPILCGASTLKTPNRDRH